MEYSYSEAGYATSKPSGRGHRGSVAVLVVTKVTLLQEMARGGRARGVWVAWWGVV